MTDASELTECALCGKMFDEHRDGCAYLPAAPGSHDGGVACLECRPIPANARVLISFPRVTL